MHVGIVSPCSSGPLEEFLCESEGLDLGCGVHFMTTLVRALIRRGHFVSVVTLSPAVTKPRVLKGRELSFYVYPMRLEKRTRDLYKLEREGLKQGIRLACPDVLHAHWTYEFAIACLEIGLPTLVTSHDSALKQVGFQRDLFRLAQLGMQVYVIRKAQWLTAVSPYLVDSLRWLRREIVMIPNPIEVDGESGHSWQQGAEPLRIATVLNGWGRRKNAKAAIRAFDLLRRKQPDAKMFMYGTDFETGGVASEWAVSNDLSQNIQFCGFVQPPDLQRNLREMSMLLHPSIEEACPLALLEAMAIGLPVVAGTNAGGVPWVLDEGRAGFLTDVRDPAKIAEAIITCINNVDVREQKRRNAYSRVASLFSPNSIAQQYERMYENVLSSF